MIVSAITGRLADYTEPADEDEFEELVRRSERLASENLAAEPDEVEFMALDPRNPADFEELVREALDDLPDLLLRALEHVAVVISDKGRRHRAYGLYQGDTAARDDYPDRIIIFRDTLLRDFGDDPGRAARAGHADGAPRAGAPPGGRRARRPRARPVTVSAGPGGWRSWPSA